MLSVGCVGEETLNTALFFGKEEEMSNTIERPSIVLPILAMRGLVMFPDMSLQFDVGRNRSIKAVREAVESNRLIFLATQVDLADGEPNADDLYTVGVVARVKQVLQNKDDLMKIHVEGLYRAEINKVIQEAPFLRGSVSPCEPVNYRESARTEATIRVALERFEEYIRWFKNIPPDVLVKVINERDCGNLADYIAFNSSVDYVKKQCVLEELHPVKRLKILNEILTHEVEVISLEVEMEQK